MNSKTVIFISTILTIVSATVHKSYDGYKLYKIVPKDDSEVKVLEGIQAKNLGEFWDDSFNVNQEAKVMVSPENHQELVRYLETEKVEATIIINDIQRAIDDQLNPDSIRSSQSYLSYSWSEYHNLEAIYNWLDELEENHPLVARTVVMGQSVEDRDIKGIIINHHPERQNPLYGILEGTLHAREWISAATVTWIIKEFLTSNNTEIRALAENFEWHIFPVVNPDGYAYTFSHNRMWRKNRSPENIKTCADGTDDDMSNGVDLNRNFDVKWMTVGASNDSCVNTYAGPTAFSEPESRAIAQYVQALGQQGEIIFYIAFHSYTQLIIIPYSHVENNDDALSSGNYPDMYEIAIRGADALEKRYGTHYRVGLSANVMCYISLDPPSYSPITPRNTNNEDILRIQSDWFMHTGASQNPDLQKEPQEIVQDYSENGFQNPMSGTSFDWVKYAVSVPITYLIELRDLGEFGFLLPPMQIVPTGLETMDALVEIGKNTKRLGYFRDQFSGANSLFFSTSIVLLGVLIALFK